jgi:hypothetical protein
MTAEKHVVGLITNKERQSIHKKDMVDMAENFHKLVKEGYITQMVMCGVDVNGQIIVFPYTDTIMATVGLLEISKQSLLTMPEEENE